jgi:hypothetical protein
LSCRFYEAPRPQGRGFPKRKFRSYGAPSCLPCTTLGSGPAGRQGPHLQGGACGTLAGQERRERLINLPVVTWPRTTISSKVR